MKAIIVILLVLSLQGAQELIQSDPGGDVDDWSVLLAYHGYDVPRPGIVLIEGTQYTISNAMVKI